MKAKEDYDFEKDGWMEYAEALEKQVEELKGELFVKKLEITKLEQQIKG